MLHVTIHREGALLEDAPSDSSVEITLDEREMKCLTSLLALESYEVAKALGSLFMAGVAEGHRASRKRKAVSAG